MTHERIGFIGIGMMGHGMAKNLLAKGFPLTFKVNRNRAQPRRPAGGRRDGGERQRRAWRARSDIVFLCVTGSPQVEEIVYGADGLLAGARDGPAGRRQLDRRAGFDRADPRRPRASAASRYVDAPLARTPKEAEEGRLNTMVGADAADFERAASRC